LQRAGEGPPERLDTGGIAIDQVSKYKYLGVVYQEDGSWQAHAQRRLQRCKQPMGTGGHCCHAAVCRQRSDCSWFRPSSIPRSCMARKCGHDEGGQRQDVSGRKDLRSILALHPRDCSSDVLYGDTGLLPTGVLIDAAKLCWQHRCQNMEADGPRRRCDSHSRVAVVSAGLRWTGAVMSNPLLSRSSTP
jgi:hypothetical protein